MKTLLVQPHVNIRMNFRTRDTRGYFKIFEIAKSHDQDLDSREGHVTDEMESIKVRSGQRRLD